MPVKGFISYLTGAFRSSPRLFGRCPKCLKRFPEGVPGHPSNVDGITEICAACYDNEDKEALFNKLYDEVVQERIESGGSMPWEK